MFNKKISGSTIKDIASSISGSSFWKKMSTNADELDDVVFNKMKHSGEATTNKIDESFRRIFEASKETSLNKEDYELIKEMSKKVDPNNINKSIDKLSKKDIKNLSGTGGKELDNIIKMMKELSSQSINEGLTKEKVLSELNSFDKFLKYPSAYFSHPTKGVTRTATVIGGYAGLSVGSRYLKGGTLTTNEYGEKDISGIPFI